MSGLFRWENGYTKTFQNSWNSDRNGVACNAVHTGGISSYLEIVLPYNDTEKLWVKEKVAFSLE